jgi:hypothetical protein
MQIDNQAVINICCSVDEVVYLINGYKWGYICLNLLQAIIMRNTYLFGCVVRDCLRWPVGTPTRVEGDQPGLSVVPVCVAMGYQNPPIG